MANLSEELSGLTHDELQYVIDGSFLWAEKTMKQRGISIRSWKAWRRGHTIYCKSFPRILVEEQIEKMRTNHKSQKTSNQITTYPLDK